MGRSHVDMLKTVTVRAMLRSLTVSSFPQLCRLENARLRTMLTR